LQEVSAALGALGVEHVLEQKTGDGLFSVDIALLAVPSPDGGGAGGGEQGKGEQGGGEQREGQQGAAVHAVELPPAGAGAEPGGAGAAQQPGGGGGGRQEEQEGAAAGAAAAAAAAAGGSLQARALAAKVAIEVDGPSHFTSNTRECLGLTLARRRLLEARGWQVLSVPYFDWAALPAQDGGSGRCAYMAALLSRIEAARGVAGAARQEAAAAEEQQR
jgi:hypothetical protein